jgi:hypothetical protein
MQTILSAMSFNSPSSSDPLPQAFLIRPSTPARSLTLTGERLLVEAARAIGFQ